MNAKELATKLITEMPHGLTVDEFLVELVKRAMEHSNEEKQKLKVELSLAQTQLSVYRDALSVKDRGNETNIYPLSSTGQAKGT